MAKRDMSKLYESGIVVNLSEPKRKPTVKPAPPANKPTPKVTAKTSNFLAKMKDGLWEQFTVSDWIEYFKYKAEQNNIVFVSSSKDAGIIKSLMTNQRVSDIRDMIDFVWEAPHKLKPKHELGLYILSGGWTMNVLNSARAWKRGEYNTNPDKPKREWSDWKEVTPVEVRQTVEVVEPPKRVNRVFI